MPSPEIVTLGETMAVFIPETPGPLRYVHGFQRSIGGAESNVAIGVVRQGHTCGWMSRLGRDELGLSVLQTIRGEGVDVSQVTWDAEAPTGLMVKERHPIGETRVFFYRKGSAASRTTPGDLSLPYICGARILHVTGIFPALSDSCRQTVLAAMRAARAAGVCVSFDPNMRRKLWTEEQARPVFREMVALSDIVLPGADEATMITGQDSMEAAAADLLAMGAQTVAVKLGPEGALVAAAGLMERVAGVPVTPVDTVGAGDAFAAAFLAGMLDGLGPIERTARACAAGALATLGLGDWESTPTAADLQMFLGGSAATTR